LPCHRINIIKEEAVHHTFNMLLHYLGKLESKFGENYTVLLKTCFISLALTRWNLNRFSQFFHCWKKEENCKQNYKKLEKLLHK